jgi:hypothetical protein
MGPETADEAPGAMLGSLIRLKTRFDPKLYAHRPKAPVIHSADLVSREDKL